MWYQNYTYLSGIIITLSMLNITTSPRINFDCLQLMRAVDEVSFKIAGNESIWCLAVKGAIRRKEPARHIITIVQQMATDNYNAIADVLGVKLTDKIMKL